MATPAIERKITAQEIMDKLEEIRQLILDVADEVQGLRPQPAPVSGGSGEQTTPDFCSIHQCAMKRHEKDGQVWYSHRIGANWCRGKAQKT